MEMLAAPGTPGANGPEGLTDWRRVNWRTVNRQVRNLRRRIFRATQQGDWATVRSLQRLMLRSHANRLQAVRRVTQVNRGKHTPGVDRVLVKTPRARGALVDELARYQPWRAQPTRRVSIPKANGKLRPLGIPTIRDRALQAMVKNALEPSWEARFEATSYGFRPGRSGHDAVQRLFNLLNPHTHMKWVVDADIESAFDHIDHEFLLEAIGPAPGRELIRQWLKAGYLEGFDWHATEAGTPQGGVITPPTTWQTPCWTGCEPSRGRTCGLATARDSRGRRCRPTRPQRAPRSTSQEAPMSGREWSKTRTLVIRPHFEPSRVAAHCLVEAYECLVPVRRRALRGARPLPPPAATGRAPRAGGGTP